MSLISYLENMTTDEKIAINAEIKESLNKTKEKILLNKLDGIETQYIGDDFQLSLTTSVRLMKISTIKTSTVDILSEIDDVLEVLKGNYDTDNIITGLLHLIKIDTSKKLSSYSFLQKTSFYAVLKNCGYYNEIQGNIKKPYK